MCDLALLAAEARSGDTMTVQQRQAANVALAGIIVYNTFAGRSGEWHNMDREQVMAKMLKFEDRIVCSKHKTSKYYGSIAKWVSPGLRNALVTYGELPNKTSSRLFEPAKESGSGEDHFHFGAALKAFGRHYTPAYEYPRINLLRKMFHSVLVRDSREGSLMQLIGQADGHSANMGMKTYALSGPKQDATLGELVYKKVFGEPVPWPTPAEIQARVDSFSAVVLAVNQIADELEDAGETYSDDEAMDGVEDAADEEYFEQFVAYVPLADAQAAPSAPAEAKPAEAQLAQPEPARGEPVMPIQDQESTSRKKRGIMYNEATGKYERYGPPAAQIVHESPKRFKQTTLNLASSSRGEAATAEAEVVPEAEVAPERERDQEEGGEDEEMPRRRGRKSPFNTTQLRFIKQWIDTNVQDLMEMGAPSATCLNEIMNEVA